MEKIKLLNCVLDSVDQSQLLETLEKGFVIPTNVDCLMKLQKDKELYEIYQKADWVICDSQVIQLGLKFLGTPVKEVIPGSSFFPMFYNFHKDNEKIKIFLLGAGHGIALKAQQIINQKVGREIIVGAISPSYGFEKNEEECLNIIKKINDSGANVLAVGVGAPKQEKWIFKYKEALINIDIFMALGATIDFEAGNVKRAPSVVQKMRVEWLYRLYREPKRLWKRYLVDDMPFFSLVFKQKRGRYKNPFVHK
ncbi:MAG: glycosyltransferase [Pseudopedobacter saltans]|uniref:Glycosyltransferase n=1 Tax=Pseudopedobacter saltans TaxID=151895 RepID=A0A2W5GIN3_9SPHI|nr:MAG: glycosyltransferase [Pseudopedobacter saltans]